MRIHERARRKARLFDKAKCMDSVCGAKMIIYEYSHFKEARMKLLHTSDWHIGHTLYSKKRYEEHGKFLDWLLQTICERQIDALIVAGDVFDSALPGGTAQRLYYQFLNSLIKTCCNNVIIIAGNHDSALLLEAPAGLLEQLNIHVVGLVSEPERHVIPLYCKNGDVGAVCCAVPYLKKSEIVRLSDDGQTSDERIIEETARFYSQVTKKALDVHGKAPIIATGHLFAAGAVRNEDDGVRELYVGNLGQVTADIFPKEIDYVALGHIHSAQCIAGTSHIRYSGSPLPMSFAEAKRDKYVIELTLGESIEKIKVPCFQRLVSVSGQIEQILSELEKLSFDDVWIEVRYTGKKVWHHISADINDAIKGGSAQVLCIRNMAVSEAALSQTESLTLNDLSVQDVFEQCIDEQITDKERQELYDCFNFIIHELEEDEPCA